MHVTCISDCVIDNDNDDGEGQTQGDNGRLKRLRPSCMRKANLDGPTRFISPSTLELEDIYSSDCAHSWQTLLMTG
jgi:hypothetical protein